MKKVLLPLTLLLVFCGFQAQAQRYLTEVFTSVDVTSNVQYGENYSVLTGSPILQSLVMDVYEPTGDVEPERPLIVLLHTGSFLPRYINQLATGDKTDSATVAIAERFARMGYVVAIPAYRTGWNPQGTQSERTQTIIQAVYRAMQDAKACTRWFRKDVAENGNSYAIDESRIAVGGQGSGGYISLAYGTVDRLEDLQLTKFFNFDTNDWMVDTTLMGDWDGMGGNPALNNVSSPGYSSEVEVTFNIGGAIGDTTWLKPGDIPVISIQGVADAFAPYSCGIVTVPGTTLFVVDVCGASEIIKRANAYGNNDRFKTPAITDSYTTRADAVNTALDGTYGNGGDEGLFAFTGVADGNGPWEFWDDATASAGATALGQDPAVILANSYASNPVYQALGPVAGKGRAMAFIDTIIGYTAPRLFRVLFEQNTSIEEAGADYEVSVYPNPTAGAVSIVTAEQQAIREVEIFTTEGRLVKRDAQLNTWMHQVDASDLPSGFYIVNIRFDEGMTTRKLMVR